MSSDRPVRLILDTSAILTYLSAPSIAAMSVTEAMEMPAEEGEATGLPVACLVEAAVLGHGVAALEPLTVHDATVTLVEDWPLITATYRMTGDLGAAAAVAARYKYGEPNCRILTDRIGAYHHFPSGFVIPIDHRGIA